MKPTTIRSSKRLSRITPKSICRQERAMLDYAVKLTVAPSTVSEDE